MTRVNGVDPGLVHTGVVSLRFLHDKKKILVDHAAISGPDVNAVETWLSSTTGTYSGRQFTYIEDYRPRSNYGTDEKMVQAVGKMRSLPNSKVINNTGVKKIVTRELMKLFGVWSFTTSTHHDDLRSAARIALFGMLKDPVQNELIADIVRDHLAGSEWLVEL